MPAKKNIIFDGKTFSLREFKMKWLLPNPSIAVIAKRGSGKSWVCRDLLRHLSDVHKIPGGIIISKTERVNPFYCQFFPDLFIHYEYSTELLEKVFYRQKFLSDKLEELKPKGKKFDPRIFLVMDDCLGSKLDWLKDKPIAELFFHGRHYFITYIITMQAPLGITPEYRGNIDYIFLLADDFVSRQKKIYDHYAGMFPYFNAFKAVFTQATLDHHCLVIINRSNNSQDISKKVFWYKATDIEISAIGNRQFNDFHTNNYDKAWKKKEGQLDANDFFNKRKKIVGSIKVNRLGEK